MSVLGIILIAFGLSADAFAVAVTYGVSLNDAMKKNALRIGAFFGFFQALMPTIGWLLGFKFCDYIVSVDHWIAFLLLGAIGGKMIYETIKEQGKEKNQDDEKEDKKKDEKITLNNKALTLLAIATSIDALVVGISFAFLCVSIVKSVLIIGIITFGLCFVGVLIGKKCGELLKSHAQLFGGIILVAIGIKILIQHLNIISIFINLK